MRRGAVAAARSASAAAKKGSRGGVYQRQPGRWAVDFRDSQLKVRQWLGTFPSEEEARAAYDAFEVQVRASLSCGGAGAVAPSPARVKIQLPAPRRVFGRRKKTQTTTTTTESSSQATVSASPSSEAAALPSSSASAAMPPPLNPPPFVVDPFLGEDDHLAADDDRFGFGLADLGHLPLPFLDDNDMDFKLSDSDDLSSLFDIGFM